MVRRLTITYSPRAEEWAKAIAEFDGPIEATSTRAMHRAADIVKAEGRASIAAAGFGERWQNTFKVEVFPKSGASIDAAAWIYHKIPYAGVFEEGATIRPSARSKLWLPLKGTPKKIGRFRVTPKNLRIAGVKLFPIPGDLLGAKVRMSKAEAKRKRPRVSLSKLRSGARGEGVLRTVPLFHGVDSVTIRKRFNITEIVERTARRLPQIYAASFRDE